MIALLMASFIDFQAIGDPLSKTARLAFVERMELVLFTFGSAFAPVAQVERNGHNEGRKQRGPSQSLRKFVCYDDARPCVEEIGQVVVWQTSLTESMFHFPVPMRAGTVSQAIPRREDKPS